MIVVIEGLDGVGKTTFAERFAEQYKFIYVKESYTDNNKEKEERMLSMFKRLISRENYIYDRTTLIDDFVYNFLNEKESTLTDYFDIIQVLLSRCKIVHLTVDEEIRKQRLEQRGDEYITNEMIEKIKEGYRFLYNKLLKSPYLYHLTNNIDLDIKNVMEVVND